MEKENIIVESGEKKLNGLDAENLYNGVDGNQDVNDSAGDKPDAGYESMNDITAMRAMACELEIESGLQKRFYFSSVCANLIVFWLGLQLNNGVVTWYKDEELMEMFRIPSVLHFANYKWMQLYLFFDDDAVVRIVLTPQQIAVIAILLNFEWINDTQMAYSTDEELVEKYFVNADEVNERVDEIKGEKSE